MVAASEQFKILETLVELEIKDGDFLKIVETLTRIGISSATGNKLYPSVHVLHKAGRYFLVPFKILFILDGNTAEITETDWQRYYTICLLLEQWGLGKIKDHSKVQGILRLELVKIIPYKDKKNWEIIPKFKIGNKKC